MNTTNEMNISNFLINDNSQKSQFQQTAPVPEWTEKKAEAKKMAIALSQCGHTYANRAERMASCSTALQSRSCPDGHTHKVIRAVLCKDRACPICSWRRSRALFARTRAAMESAGGRYIHVVFTIKNPPDGELRAAFAAMSKAFGEMMRDKALRGVVGGYIRTMEVTRGDGWHPHIHAILRVDEGYFARGNGLYIEHQGWRELWKKYLKVDYLPGVRLRTVLKEEAGGAVAEITKYVTKSSVVYGLPLELLKDWLVAIKGFRLWATGGCLKVKEEDIEEEMIHKCDEEETPDYCPVCGQRLVTVDWYYTEHAGYVQSAEPIGWPKARKKKRRRRAAQ